MYGWICRCGMCRATERGYDGVSVKKAQCQCCSRQLCADCTSECGIKILVGNNACVGCGCSDNSTRCKDCSPMASCFVCKISVCAKSEDPAQVAWPDYWGDRERRVLAACDECTRLICIRCWDRNDRSCPLCNPNDWELAEWEEHMHGELLYQAFLART